TIARRSTPTPASRAGRSPRSSSAPSKASRRFSLSSTPGTGSIHRRASAGGAQARDGLQRALPLTGTRRTTFVRLKRRDGRRDRRGERAMTTTAGVKVQFAADHDVPIAYMQRTRDYYQQLGFAPYRWAHFADVPWAPLRTPLDRARVTLVTTAAPFQPGVGDQGPGAAYNAAAKFYQVYSMPTETVPDLRVSHVG